MPDAKTILQALVDGLIYENSDGEVNPVKVQNAFAAIINRMFSAPYTESASSGSFTLDAGNYDVFELTLTGNVAVPLPVNMLVGQGVTVLIIQDGSGGHTATLNAGYAWGGGTAPTLTTTAGAVDMINVVRTNTGYDAAAVLDVKTP